MEACGNLACALQIWCPLDLSQEWVDGVWELEFTETEPLDASIEAEIVQTGLSAFTELYSAMLPFATEKREAAESIWTFFMENRISHNALMALFHHFVYKVLKKNVSAQQQEFGLHAAGLYFLLLEVPGSVVNQVFHPVIFDKCIQILKKCWPQESSLNQKRKKEQPKNPQGNSQESSKRARPHRREEVEMDEITPEEEDEENVFFSSEDRHQIRNVIFHVLKNFIRLLSKFSLKEKPECIQNCVEVFVALTSFEPVHYEFQVTQARILREMKYIPELAYHGLYLLCSPLHREGDKVLRYVLHQMLYIILMVEVGKGSHHAPLAITPPVVSSRKLAIQFVSLLVDELRESMYPVLRTLLQHICVKVVDKSEYRTYAAQSLVQLLNKLPCAEYASFMAWLYGLTRNAKVSYRVFTLDVALALLELPEREVDGPLTLEHKKFLKHKFLVQEILVARCKDKAPTVRSKALSSFAHCLESSATAPSDSIQELLQNTPAAPGVQSHQQSPSTNSSAFSYQRQIHNPSAGSEVIHTDSSGEAAGSMAEMGFLVSLRNRVGDEKTSVRKSAVQVLVNLLKHCSVAGLQAELSILQDRCRDVAVSVRKQALQSLTELLLAQPQCVQIQKAWLGGVVPAVTDNESSVQDKALECLDRLLLQSIRHHSEGRKADDGQALAWALLALLDTDSRKLGCYLNKAFHIWSRKDRFSPTFVNNVLSHTEKEHSAPAWMLLAKVAGASPTLDYSTVMEAWERMSSQQNPSEDTLGHILCVIRHIAKHLPQSTRDRVADVLKKKLNGFCWSTLLITPAVDTLQSLCRVTAETPAEEQELLAQASGDVLATCVRHLSDIILKEDGPGRMREDLMVKYVFTLGDVAQLCPALVDQRTTLLILSILAASPSREPRPRAPPGSSAAPASQPLSQVQGVVMPSVIRAHAVITLGKLCLQHEDLAKQSVPVLVRELEVGIDGNVLNNVVIVLCDLCVRYTALVDKYVPTICTCLKDPNPFVRKQALLLLTGLLQEDFVRWKGCLFFRFVITVVDPNPEVASTGEVCLVHLLLKRNPTIFYQHFIEGIFHFTSYEKHESFNRFPQSEREKRLFSLKGGKNRERRMRIYKFLLEHFTDEQRFNITSRIFENVLACFADGDLPLDMEASELLSDTFEVLSSKEIRLQALRARADKEQLGEEEELAQARAALQESQKKLLSQVQKRNLIEMIIPIITSLKSALEKNKIPALRELMLYLREVMQDYGDEVKDFFTVDKQLAAELEYDMRRYQEQLTEQQEPVLSLETIPAPAGREKDTAAATADQPSTPHAAHTAAPLSLVPKDRPMSASTMDILSSVKKVVEARRWHSSRTAGLPPSDSRPESPAPMRVLELESSGADLESSGVVDLETKRGISTPEQTIPNVTFGSEISYIVSPGQSLPLQSRNRRRTPGSRRGSRAAGQGDNVLCLSLPDMPPPQTSQWNVTSPSRSDDCAATRRSRRQASKKRAK
ncbi:condensin-2 complex subunit D3 isoform X1 [Cervus canadensis]|uniref:condensin-2 complex subunit D3 isoform X1 n=1 Tax=Cervus canadensis TaxID=1574408 RepID=UPI001C9E7A0A|nr:condensin-2 complex subunit D3 isoform X1 [Cervus canadensis]